MSGHTPGPWLLETIQTSVGICHRIGPFPPRRPDDETVRHACLYADYPSACNPADKELEANARLIAAAPDLLEALENCEKRLTNMVGMSDLCANEIQSSIDAARKAIASAKGEA